MTCSQTLEIHHLANRDPHLHFALLTDWPDAAQENLPEDEALLERTKAGIESLNRKYAGGRRDLFFLFHRPRRWNASENVWMGYERKRGKLMQFNAFLRGRCADCFAAVVGDLTILPEIKYVITLDTDTQLPRESARQLIGTMAHPLNRPQFDPARGIVTEGYSLLQPRVDVSLPTADRSRFVRLHAGEVGIDPYTRTVSDVYQDLFGEGSFIGKGIYDVDAFERTLAGRFPENRILSHDLLESVYARCGLVSDVTLYEEYPSRYEIDAVRRHRWIRGDWQILPWLLPRVPDAEGRRHPQSDLGAYRGGKFSTTCGAALFRSRSCLFSSRAGCSFRSSACWRRACSSPSSRCQVCFRSSSNSCASRSSCRGECICVECWRHRNGRSARSDLPSRSCQMMPFSV